MCCACLTYSEIERNLVANNTQTLDHWKQFNMLFPLTVSKAGLSQAESLMYRYMYVCFFEGSLPVSVVKEEHPSSLNFMCT